jgi:hypothetical protein
VRVVQASRLLIGIQTLTGKRLELEVVSTDSVAAVKGKIEERLSKRALK